jgi:hypothetical protein
VTAVHGSPFEKYLHPFTGLLQKKKKKEQNNIYFLLGDIFGVSYLI